MRTLLLALLVTLGLLATACSDDDPFRPLTAPKTEATPSTETTVRPDFDDVPLPAVAGTTTTAPIGLGPGQARINGRVDGPDGPVAGAIVRVERLQGDAGASTQVPTAEDGTWNVADVLGGRYRVRAWRTPDLAMTRTEVFFLDGGGTQNLVLRVDAFQGTRVDSAIAPTPPVIEEPANLRVRVVSRVVDAEGIVRTTPQSGVEVMLAGSGAWDTASPNPSFTDGTGSVVFRMTCRQTGPQPLTAVLDGTNSYPLSIPDCIRPAPSTTTTSADGSGTTTSTSTTSTTRPSNTTTTTEA